MRGVSIPFPEPVETVDGVARFARDEVVDWLTRTGRGNNREHSDDAPAVAVPDGVALEDVVTLLCWHVLTGEELAGTSLPHRVRRAEEFDPDDLSLLHEIRGLQAPESTLNYVDDLVEASFGSPDALARLEQGRLKRALGARELTDEAVQQSEAPRRWLHQDIQRLQRRCRRQCCGMHAVEVFRRICFTQRRCAHATRYYGARGEHASQLDTARIPERAILGLS
ncbi:hypothetical protein BST46_26875 [Mycobacterium timonense]|uniref:DUF222 domain-containing protein n=1 Tax=Mycobacterium timonense TaxID=701043 RepID=A0ABX3TDY3_9MYCO|nr:hypothetical protein BST46_26875 [Mycobacterium timonense]